MSAALVLLVTRHEVASVIAHEDENCVLGQMLLFEDAAHAAHRGIDGFDAAVVVRQLSLPCAGKSAEIVGGRRVGEALHRTVRADRTVHIILLVWLDLRDEEKEGLCLLLAKEPLRPIGDEVDAILVLISDLLSVADPR